MTQLEWELKNLMDYNRDGSSLTQEARAETFSVTINEAKELGMPRITLNSLLKPKTLTKYISKWQRDGKSIGTIKNRMSHIRWAAKHKGLIKRIPTNEKLGIGKRKNITNIDKSARLKQKHLNKISNQNIRDSLRLQSAFGLRREAAIKFNPVYSDKGNKIVLKSSWCKGGRSREIPITNVTQRELIDELKGRYGNNSLIPSDKKYVQQKNIYKNLVSKIQLGLKGHSLRHQYAHDRYKELTGNECPVKGGMRQRNMTPQQRSIDKSARLTISAELGHNREQITANYLGS